MLRDQAEGEAKGMAPHFHGTSSPEERMGKRRDALFPSKIREMGQGRGQRPLCKGPDSKCIRLLRPQSLCCNHSPVQLNCKSSYSRYTMRGVDVLQ